MTRLTREQQAVQDALPQYVLQGEIGRGAFGVVTRVVAALKSQSPPRFNSARIVSRSSATLSLRPELPAVTKRLIRYSAAASLHSPGFRQLISPLRSTSFPARAFA